MKFIRKINLLPILLIVFLSWLVTPNAAQAGYGGGLVSACGAGDNLRMVDQYGAITYVSDPNSVAIACVAYSDSRSLADYSFTFGDTWSGIDYTNTDGSMAGGTNFTIGVPTATDLTIFAASSYGERIQINEVVGGVSQTIHTSSYGERDFPNKLISGGSLNGKRFTFTGTPTGKFIFIAFNAKKQADDGEPLQPPPPFSVSGVTGCQANGDSVNTLTWTPPATASYYMLSRSDNPNYWIQLGIDGLSGPIGQFVDDGYTPGSVNSEFTTPQANTTYTYQVRAINAVGATTSTATVVTGNCTVPPPGSFSLTGLTSACQQPAAYSGASIPANTLTWNAASGATDYLIYRNDGPGTPVRQIASQPASSGTDGKEIGASGTSHTDATVSPGVTYLYRVYASNRGVTTPSTNTLSVVTTANCHTVTIEVVPDGALIAPGQTQSYSAIVRFDGAIIPAGTGGLTYTWMHLPIDQNLPQSSWGTLSNSLTATPTYSAAASLASSSAQFIVTATATYVRDGIVYYPTDSANLTVTAAVPTLILTANPSSIAAGQVSQLSWTSTNAATCSASGGWSGAKTTAGNQFVQPAITTTYTLTCTGPGGQVTRQATVTVLGQSLTVTITPTAVNLRPGQTQQFSAEVRYNGAIVTPTTLTWSVTTPAAGTIDPVTGVFTAGSVTASFPLAIRADATYAGQQAFGRGSATVLLGIQVRGDVLGRTVTGLTLLDPKSIVAAEELANLFGERIELAGYSLTSSQSWTGFVTQMQKIIDGLIKERSRPLATSTVSQFMNLNPLAEAEPSNATNNPGRPEGTVWVHHGNLTLDAASFANRGTIVVIGGDVTIQGNLEYVSNSRNNSLGVIVLAENGVGGNVTVTDGATQLVGAYYLTGTMRFAGTADVPSHMSGTIAASEIQFGPIDLIIEYDPRIVVTPPPGFSDIYPTTFQEAF